MIARKVEHTLTDVDHNDDQKDEVDSSTTGRFLIKKYVSVKISKQDDNTIFGIATEQEDKFAVVLFAQKGDGQIRSYLNAGSGRTRADAFRSAKMIMERARELNPHIKKVYGVVSRLYLDRATAERTEKRFEKDFVHKLF